MEDLSAQAPAPEDFEADTVERPQPRPTPAFAPHAAGERIARYIVLEVLGAGGMGVVYAAYDPSLDRKVAIKVLRSARRQGHSGGDDRNRLLREAQAMAQLSHPNVVPVHDVGTDGDAIFVAMELVQGPTLHEWLKVKRPWRQVLAMLLAAGRGLKAAHDAGLVHRDFKPANVLIGRDGRPQVTDFGLARSLRSLKRDRAPRRAGETSGPVSLETPLTLAGAVMGSPGYMAPEQYDGAVTSAATDQYAFCVTVYEALYGVRPFEAKELIALGVLAREGKVPPPPRGSPVPARLWAVLQQGLSPDPAKRHASMGALLEALEKDPARVRNRRLLGAAAVVLLASGVGAAT